MFLFEGAKAGGAEAPFDDPGAVLDVAEFDLADSAGIADEANGATGGLFLEAVAAPGEATWGDEEEIMTPGAAVRFEE